MNKFTFWKKRIINKYDKISSKYNCEVQLVSNLPANACIIKLDKKYIIFVSEKLDMQILPLSIFHEFGHIKFNTINSNPQKYNYLNETLANLYAVSKLMFYFKSYQKLILLFFVIFSEKRLYEYFKNNNVLGGEYIYEKIS